MQAEEAINILEPIRRSAAETSTGGFEQRPIVYALQTAIDALGKQIKKKPEFWRNPPCGPDWADDDWRYRCPCCGNEDIDIDDHHCKCGQWLDWSEE